MIKTLQNTLRQDKEQFTVPRSVQDTIPIRRIWPDGIFQFGSKFSKCIRFSDINYAIASKEDKTAMFLNYSELLNALDTGSTTKITINNKRLNRQNFEETILLPPRGDFLDGYRAEYNTMLTDKVTDASNSVVQERYITVSTHKKNVDEAKTFFDRVTNDITSRLNKLDSRSEELDAIERLRILHDFYRVGEETEFHFNLKDSMRKGASYKDAICPDSMEFKKDHFVMGDKFGRVLFLKEYASYIKDSMINELTELNRTLMLSIDVIPVPTDEAVREMQNRLLGVETKVTNWQRRQNSNNNFSAVVPYDLEQQRKETREMLDDLTTRDQRMMFAVVTLVHLADSKEELDSDTETLQSIARKHLCQLSTLNWQQAEGLVTALPLGLRRIDALRLPPRRWPSSCPSRPRRSAIRAACTTARIPSARTSSSPTAGSCSTPTALSSACPAPASPSPPSARWWGWPWQRRMVTAGCRTTSSSSTRNPKCDTRSRNKLPKKLPYPFGVILPQPASLVTAGWEACGTTWER